MDESELRPVLGPAGNKVELLKPVSKPNNTNKKPHEIKSPTLPILLNSPLTPPPNSNSTPSILKKHQHHQLQHRLLNSNLSMTASSSSDASSDSSPCRASTRKSCRQSAPIRRKQHSAAPVKVGSAAGSVQLSPTDATSSVNKRCSWITPNTDPCYAAFHDEEWGVPVHDDKKLFELLSLSTALAELTWPAILNKRQIFREVFQDFDPVSVSKLNEKKLTAPGSSASSLLSELKVRGVIENARQMCKIMNEFGSFNKYIWGFVNNRPTVGQFRYPRQVPIKTSKADMISKDLVKRGFRGVGPTVVYSFMQVAGITNDHLISCFRFQECIDTEDARNKDDSINAKAEGKQPKNATDLEVAGAIDDLSLPTE